MSFLLTPARRSASTIQTLSRTRTFATSPAHSLARMTIVGRVGTDPEVNETSNGGKVIRHVVGSSSGPKDNQVTSWFRVATFVQPEQTNRENYFMGIGKGTLVYLEGDASMRTYDDAEGKKQTALSVIQTKLEVLKRPNTPSDSEGTQTTGV